MAAISAFADPHIRLALRFTVPEQPPVAAAPENVVPVQIPEAEATADAPAADETRAEGEAEKGEGSQVVSLAAFRKRGPGGPG